MKDKYISQSGVYFVYELCEKLTMILGYSCSVSNTITLGYIASRWTLRTHLATSCTLTTKKLTCAA